MTEILTIMRFEEREMLMPIGLAAIEEDEMGNPVLVLRLSFTDRKLFVPLWDLLVLWGIDKRTVARYLRRWAAVRARRA
jgi:hypothetical protein